MPQSKEVHKEYMRQRREGSQKQGSQTKGSQDNVTLLSRPNGPDYNPTEKLYNNPHYTNGTLRYLGPLSDGQVLDRLTVS